jgi:hypothetical protein
MLYTVIVKASDVEVSRLEPGAADYEKASGDAILRERDAIELFGQQESTGHRDGVYTFHNLDNAKTFALLHLQAMEAQVESALDRIQAYEG